MNAAPARAGALHGFTLIEMLVVLTLVGILAAAAVPLQELTLRRAQESALREALRTLRTALDAYRQAVEDKRIAPGRDGAPWPPSLEALVEGVPLLDGEGRPRVDARLYLLRRLPRDPFADPALPAAQTWALRSSQSPPDAPAPGADIFDVASRAQVRGIDGSLVKDW